MCTEGYAHAYALAHIYIYICIYIYIYSDEHGKLEYTYVVLHGVFHTTQQMDQKSPSIREVQTQVLFARTTSHLIQLTCMARRPQCLQQHVQGPRQLTNRVVLT